MVFLWLVMLHIPRAVTAVGAAGVKNEWTSVFEALAVSGLAFLLAGALPAREAYPSASRNVLTWE